MLGGHGCLRVGSSVLRQISVPPFNEAAVYYALHAPNAEPR